MKKILTYLAIGCLVILILRHSLNHLFKNKIVEGATGHINTAYIDPNLSKDPLYLAKTNAANISYLKGQLERINNLSLDINDMKKDVTTNTKTLTSLSQKLVDQGNSKALDNKTANNLANSGNIEPPGSRG